MVHHKHARSSKHLKAAPYLLGATLFAVMATPIARQDAAAYLGLADGHTAWRMAIVPSAAGSMHGGTLAFTGNQDHLSGLGVTVKGESLAISNTSAKRNRADTSDQSEAIGVNRDAKQDRLTTEATMRLKRAARLGARLGAPLGGQFGTDELFQPPSVNGIQHMAFAGPIGSQRPHGIAPGVSTTMMAAALKEEQEKIAAAEKAKQEEALRLAALKPQSILPEDQNNSARLTTGSIDNSVAGTSATALVDPSSTSLAARSEGQAQISRFVANRAQRKCLAEGIYFEARGESVEGQIAVAQVIMNRVRHHEFPSTVCGVVYQNKHWRNRCQFSFACDGIPDRVRETRAWKTAETVADDVLQGKAYLEDVNVSTHYHATYVRPRWARKMIRLTRIGTHIFYKGRYGGWR